MGLIKIMFMKSKFISNILHKKKPYLFKKGFVINLKWYLVYPTLPSSEISRSF